MKHPIDCTHYLTLTVAMFSATLGFCLFLSAHSLVILWILWAIQNPPNKFPSSLSYACIYEPLKSIWNILLFFFLSAENNVTFSAPSIIHFHTWIFIKITWWTSLTHRLLGPTPMVSDTEWSSTKNFMPVILVSWGRRHTSYPWLILKCINHFTQEVNKTDMIIPLKEI